MDTASFLQIVYISVGLVLIGIGVLIIFILYEIHQGVRKIRNVLSRAEAMVSFLENKIFRPTFSASEYVSLAKDFLSLALAFKKSFSKDSKGKKDE
ncbi:MAG: hypothetical protein Q8P13_05340 [bacterium]|nr:hypothetical protein [bacterium]